MLIVITSGAFLLAVFILLSFICVTRNAIICKRNLLQGIRQEIWNYTFVFYLAVVISFTLLPITWPTEIEFYLDVNLNVLDLLDCFRYRYVLISYANNVLLFVPLGIFGYLSTFRIFKSVRSSLLCSLIISLAIEAFQAAEIYFRIVEDFEPVVDINDVICNAAGGVFGFLIIYFYKREHGAVHAMDPDGDANRNPAGERDRQNA